MRFWLDEQNVCLTKRRGRRDHCWAMTDSLDDLVLDLLAWLGSAPRPYAEVLEAWHTSCPRLPVWEEANDRGFIQRHRTPDGGRFVSVSAAGANYLRAAATAS
jgi:D-3-phosphoglycerate dehydrogenase